MYKYYNIIKNYINIGEKINKQHLPNFINFLKIKQVEITFRIPSKTQYSYGFIAMLMLTEKLVNNTPIFLLDRNTLSNNKTIKIGLIITLKNEMMDYYLFLCSLHSVPKFYTNNILFNSSYLFSPFNYKSNKILSNSLFSFDKDINSYYEYLNELPFEFDFLYRTFFKDILMNKLLISNNGINYINEIITFTNKINLDIKDKILLEDSELNESDLNESDLDELDLEELDLDELDLDDLDDLDLDDLDDLDEFNLDDLDEFNLDDLDDLDNLDLDDLDNLNDLDDSDLDDSDDKKKKFDYRILNYIQIT